MSRERESRVGVAKMSRERESRVGVAKMSRERESRVVVANGVTNGSRVWESRK